MENENLSDLGDFFSLIGGEKKKQNEEVQSLIGDLGSVLLELDKVSKQTKAVKKKQIIVKKVEKEPKVKVEVNNLFDELATLKKHEKEKKRKEQEEIKAFESWLFTQPSEIKEEIIEIREEPEEVIIEEELAVIEEPEETEQVTEQEEIEEESEEKDEKNATVSQVLETLKTIIKDDDIVEEKDTEIESLKKEVKDLRNLLYQGLRDISAQGGGGEVRLEFLDDVDRNSVKTNGQVLAYNSSTGKFIGTTVSSSNANVVGIDTLGTSHFKEITATGIVTATQFVGDGSGLTGIVASGSGIVIRNESSLVGTAATINFNEGFNAAIASGVATIDADMDMGTF
jgi:hypothetical protein